MKQGKSPNTGALEVLAAVRDERFYVLTHPAWLSYVEQRMNDILSGGNPTLLPVPGIDSSMRKMGALQSP